MAGMPPGFQALGKASRRTAILTILGFAIVIVSLVYSSHTMYSLNTRIKTKQRELARYEKQLKDRQEQYRQLTRKSKELTASHRQLAKRYDAKRAALARVAIQLATGKVAAARRTVRTQQLSSDATSSAGQDAKPRVYFQVSTPRQANSLGPIRTFLSQKGYSVPRTEILSTVESQGAVVWYFRKDDETEARRIRSMLIEHGLPDCQPRYVPGFEGSERIKARHYEVWLGPDVPARRQ